MPPSLSLQAMQRTWQFYQLCGEVIVVFPTPVPAAWACYTQVFSILEPPTNATMYYQLQPNRSARSFALECSFPLPVPCGKLIRT